MKWKSNHPPGWADKLLERFCVEHLVEVVQGDLYELFHKRSRKKGIVYAKLFFVLEVVGICGRFVFKRKRSNSNKLAMFYNYYKVAIRNLMRHKMYSAIKIGGFALGITICLLITFFIADEMSYDKHYQGTDKIYRLLYYWNEPGESYSHPSFQAPAADVVKNEVPGVELVGRLIPRKWFRAGGNLFRSADVTQNIYENGFVYADQGFFDIITPEFISGDAKSALSMPNSMVITRQKAEKYFPDGDAVGKVVLLNNDAERPFKITGVIDNLPNNTHFNFDFVMTLKGVEFWNGEQTSWCCNNYHTYIKLSEEADKDAVVGNLDLIKRDYVLPYQKTSSSADEMIKMDQYFGVGMQPISDIHLKSSDIIDRTYIHGDLKIVWMFAAVALLIMLLACINFINLSTAKSANRAKEVGLRKVVGSRRGNLIGQFLTESIMFSLISFFLGLILTVLLIPYFNELSQKSLTIPIGQWWFIPSLLFVAILVGIVAGIYPSFYLSAFKPIEVIKGKLSLGIKNSGLQSGLVIFQFTVSIVLIVGAIVVDRQMGFVLNKKLGFEKDQVILIQGTNTLEEKVDLFKNSLKDIPSVQHATVSHYYPVSKTQRDMNQFWKEGMRKLAPTTGAQAWYVDDEYLNTLGMKIVKGRNFSSTMASDSNAIVVNEAMVKELGYEDPIGKKISNGYLRTIVGVVEDFHYESMTTQIEPLCLMPGRNSRMMAVRISGDNTKATLAAITGLWDELQPSQPIRYRFMSEQYAEMYGHVKRTGLVFTIFAMLAIVIACLGLFALSAFTVEQRRKEISIRKVLGANLKSLFKLLSTNYLKMVAIAFIIALPLGWYIMNYWLDGYEYKVGITWDIFILAGSTIFFIAFATISYEIIRAVNNNPSDALNTE